jgi:hypothetical protein
MEGRLAAAKLTSNIITLEQFIGLQPRICKICVLSSRVNLPKKIFTLNFDSSIAGDRSCSVMGLGCVEGSIR